MSWRKPWLLVPAGLAHSMSPYLLPVVSRWGKESSPSYAPLRWSGQTFRHPLGLAGGVDKNGRNLVHWERLGASFLEVGTVTPRPQNPNPPPLLLRDKAQKALWNQLGFPNDGAEAIYHRIANSFQHCEKPLWINVGKNRDTTNEKALTDYMELFEKFSTLASSFVVNISSPNTQSLRDLQTGEFLKNLMESYRSVEHLQDKPVLLKLSPDLETEQLKELLRTGEDLGVGGWILGNTTRSRRPGDGWPADKGGVSGKPLAALALKNLKTAVELLGTRAAGRRSLLVSVGGVMNAQDVRERLALGADLIQVYTALVMEGPWFFRKTLKELTKS